MDPLLSTLLAGGPVKITNKSDNFIAGSGLVVLRKLLYDGPPKFEKVTFVAEWQIVTSEPSGDTDAQGRLIQPNTPGAIVGYVQHPASGTPAAKVAPGNIKMVVCALGGLTSDEGDQEVEVNTQTLADGKIVNGKEKRPQWAELLGQLKNEKTQPGVGIVCRYRASLVSTKEDRAKNLPRHAWHTFAKFEAVEQTPAQVERLAKLIAEGKKVTAADLDPSA